MDKYKVFSFTLEEQIVKELQDMDYNLSKLIRRLLKEKLEKVRDAE